MKRKGTKLLALLLAVVMVVSLAPLTALATEGTDESTTVECTGKLGCTANPHKDDCAQKLEDDKKGTENPDATPKEPTAECTGELGCTITPHKDDCKQKLANEEAQRQAEEAAAKAAEDAAKVEAAKTALTEKFRKLSEKEDITADNWSDVQKDLDDIQEEAKTLGVELDGELVKAIQTKIDAVKPTGDDTTSGKDGILEDPLKCTGELDCSANSHDKNCAKKLADEEAAQTALMEDLKKLAEETEVNQDNLEAVKKGLEDIKTRAKDLEIDLEDEKYSGYIATIQGKIDNVKPEDDAEKKAAQDALMEKITNLPAKEAITTENAQEVKNTLEAILAEAAELGLDVSQNEKILEVQGQLTRLDKQAELDKLISELPAPDTIDPENETQVQDIFTKIQAIKTLATELGIADITVSNETVRAVVEATWPTAPAVAKIGDTDYETLDDAIAAAQEGDTIVLLEDVTTENGILISGKSVTITGAEGAHPTITFANKGIAVMGGGSTAGSLTIQNCALNMDGVTDNPQQGGESILVNFYCTFKLENSELNLSPSAGYGGHGIFLHGGAHLYFTSGSNVRVSGYSGSGASGIYCEPDHVSESTPSQIQVIGSSLTVTGCCWGGMTVNEVDTLVDGGSNVLISGNGVNGGRAGYNSYYGTLTVRGGSNFTVKDNVGSSWGAFVKEFTIENATATFNNNTGSAGLTVGGHGNIASSATVNANQNSGYGLWVYKGSNYWYGDVAIASGAAVSILENQGGGILNKNTLNMASGTVMRNQGKYGGGLCNYPDSTATLTNAVQIYNNHATGCGDDIFTYDGGTVNLGVVGNNWFLDGAPDCNHQIDGWYDDSPSACWSVHTPGEEHLVLQVGQSFTYTTQTALKAAHGKLVDVTIEKNWQDMDNAGQTRPEKITVKLLADGVEAARQEIGADAQGKWSATFTDVPFSKPDGTAITYTAAEEPVPGYTSSVNGLTITNTLEYRNIAGEKVWKDDQPSDRPEKIVVRLWNGNKEIDSVEVKPAADGSWKFVFQNVPVYYNGQLITYTLSEDTVPGYTTSIQGFTVTNQKQAEPAPEPAPETVSLTVKKVWKNDSSASRPASVQVQLQSGKTILDTVTLNQDNGWTYTWTGLEKGKNYLAVEKVVPSGYRVSYTTSGDTVTITNTKSYTPYYSGSGKLLQTGQLNWPIPVLTVGGFSLLAVGLYLVLKKKKGHYEA